MELYPHQKEIIELSRSKPHLGLLWDCGVGKTCAAVKIVEDKRRIYRKFVSCLVFTPVCTVYNWKDEFQKFSDVDPDRVIVINKTGKSRINQISKAIKDFDKECIIVCNWESIRNDDVLNIFLSWCPNMIIGDELHVIKSYKAKTAQKAVLLANAVRAKGGHILGLTGTAILNKAEDIFMQYKFLDGGELLGTNFFTFRHIYMTGKDFRFIHGKYTPTNWVLCPTKEVELKKKISSIATQIDKKDCLKLPPLIKMPRYVDMSIEQARMYNQMKQQFLATILQADDPKLNRVAVANMAVTQALRMMQIISGYTTDDTGCDYVIEKNPRMDVLEELLEEITPKHKVIVWACWKRNYQMIKRLCDKMKLKAAMITGGLSPEEVHAVAQEFDKDEETRVLIGSRAAGGVGINLVAASYSIVYSRNFSLKDEKQSEARNYRGGSEQHESIVKIDLVSRGTIEEEVIQALNNKQDVSNFILDWRSI